MSILYESIKSIILNLNKKYVIDLDSFILANESHLLPFLYLSMDKNTNEDIKNKITNLFNSYILYDSMQEEEYKKIIDSLNQNNIQYSILKGYHLKKYYPESSLRYMCDMDILIKKEDFKRAEKILLNHGYSKGEFTNHDQGYIKNPFNIELHYKLISQTEYGGKYFTDPFSLMEKINDNEYVFKRKEDEYFYYLCHLLKHYLEYGIGFRNFLDLYLFIKKNDLDFTYIRSLYKYTKYENDCIYLEGFVQNLFEEKEEYKELLDDIINDKTYGTMQKMMERELENESSLKWLVKKIFPNLKYMKNRYSILRHKIGYILLPLLYIHHWIKYGIFKLGYSIKKYRRAKKIKQEN